MRDHHTSTVEAAAAYERHHGDDYPEYVPDASDLAGLDDLNERARAATAGRWAIGAERCPTGHLTILPLRGSSEQWIAVCAHHSHQPDAWGSALLVSEPGTRQQARAHAIAHHASTGHPYGEALPDPEPDPDAPF